jgi:hypothetical protein
MEVSILSVQIYFLIILITWLIGLRLYKYELFVEENSYTGESIFVWGISWPLLVLIVLVVMGYTRLLKLLNKMHNIKF